MPSDKAATFTPKSPPPKYKFQYLALGLINARPTEENKGADQRIDGRRYLTDSAGESKTIITFVKGGHVGAARVRNLRGVIEREDAAIGVFFTLGPTATPNRTEVTEAGFVQSAVLTKIKHPRLQILTVEDLLAGKKIDMPTAQDIRGFKQGPKVKVQRADEAALF